MTTVKDFDTWLKQPEDMTLEFKKARNSFSREKDLIVEGLTLKDMDESAMENFKKRWAEKANRKDYLSFSNDKTLRAVGLLTDKGLNYAALILFGKKENIDEMLPCSEIIFEWRQDVKKTAHDFRKNWREPFFKVCDEIWETINARQILLTFDEIYELEKIRENQPVHEVENRKKFLDMGVIEQVGKTKGAKYILSHTYYAHEGKVGIHTRLTGLLREKNKELIIKHLGKNKGYLHDLQLAFQELKPQDISNLLQELKRERKIRFVGPSKTGYWEIAN